MARDYSISGTSLWIEFDRNRDDYKGGHGLHCHVADSSGRIASVNLESSPVVTRGSLDGKEGRKAMEWIRDNYSTLRSDAEYWRDNGAIWQ